MYTNLTKHLPNLAAYNNNNDKNEIAKNAKNEVSRRRVRRELQIKAEQDLEHFPQKKDIIKNVDDEEKEEDEANDDDEVVSNTVVSLLTTRDMIESLIIDLITNKPTTDNYNRKVKERKKKKNIADDVTQVAEVYNRTVIKEQPNVNQQADDIHMTFNVNDENKNEMQNKLENDKMSTTINILQNENENEEETTTTFTYNKTENDDEEKEDEAPTIGISNGINVQKRTRFNAPNQQQKQEQEVEKSNFTKMNNNHNNKENYTDNDTITKQQQEQQELLSKNLLEEQHEQQQIKMQMYNNSDNNNNNNNNQINNLKENKFIATNSHDMMRGTTVKILRNIYYDDDDTNDNVVGHSADNYGFKSNQVDNVTDKGTELANGETNMNVIIVNNYENKSIIVGSKDENVNEHDDGYLIKTTTAKQDEQEEEENKNIEHKMLEVDKFILNDRQIDSTTIEKVEQPLMEINEKMLIVNSTEQRMKPHVNVNSHDDNNDNDDDVDAAGNEVGKLTPQHLLLDELMLNDAGIEGPIKFVNKRKEKEEIFTNNDVILNYIDNESDKENDNENIDIVNLVDKDNNLDRHKQSVPTDDLYYKTLPAPQVVESFDKPNKRILVNVTIATDDADGSVYTLHVVVPTGRGPNNEKNIEQVLTHERRQTQTNDVPVPSIPYCYPEPPPTMPECPCACADFSLTNNIDHENIIDNEHEHDLDKYDTTTLPTIDATTILSTTTTQMHDNDIDTTIMGVGNTTSTTISTACPDVMPILILEGARTFPARSFPPDGTTFGQISIGQKLSKEIQPYSYWNMQFYQSEPAYVKFDYTIPRGASIGVYGRRNALPTHTQYHFKEVLNGFSATQRTTRAAHLTIIREVTRYMEPGHWFISLYNDDGDIQEVTFYASIAEDMTQNCPNGCTGNGQCLLGHCQCNPGFGGDDCSESVCPVLCSTHGEYINGECICNPGWKGKECSLRHDECEVADCSGHGHCVSGKCQCMRGYKGKFCEEGKKKKSVV